MKPLPFHCWTCSLYNSVVMLMWLLKFVCCQGNGLSSQRAKCYNSQRPKTKVSCLCQIMLSSNWFWCGDSSSSLCYFHCSEHIRMHWHNLSSFTYWNLPPSFRNVLLVNSSADHLKVGDFGLSKLIKVQNSHDVYKMTGETGSCEYLI